MNYNKLKLGLILLILGLMGVASMLTMDFTIPPEAEAILRQSFSDQQIKLLMLINPAILVVIAVVTGTLLYQKINLSVPFLEKLAGIRTEEISFRDTIFPGVIGGVISGLLISLVIWYFSSVIPSEFMELSGAIKISLAGRFLYGGITEEILIRFGVMTFLIWLMSLIFKKRDWVYWMGILLSAFIFALGHFPAAFQALGDPSTTLLSYILIGNSLGGIIFGWLYWKKGLESAMIAHIFTHVVMVSFEALV